jgi:hypothetical protein
MSEDQRDSWFPDNHGGKRDLHRSPAPRMLTRVVGGSSPSLRTERHICSGVPSKKRPHPPTNNTSPVKTAGGEALAAGGSMK